MTSDIKTATRKVGSNRGKPRLWIEGKILIDAGLDHGQRWDLVPTDDGFKIVNNPSGKRKVAGKPGRPIIDITGSTLGSLGMAEKLSLSYILGAGVVRVSGALTQAPLMAAA